MRQVLAGSPALYILLALSTKERHGYDIMKQVDNDSGGALHIGPATLYTTIRRLLEAGLIEEADERPDAGLDDQRRRYYRLSATGRQAVQEEIERLDHLVKAFRPGVA